MSAAERPEPAARSASLVVVGASSGGVEALIGLLSRLPADFALPMAVVLHQGEDRDSVLAQVLGRHTPLAVREARDKEPLAAGCVHVAPPGYHLLLEDAQHLALSCDPPEYFSRPSIDALFETASQVLGPRLCGVLLTGANHDGAAGLARLGAAGGLTLVQSPTDAANPEMPLAAIERRTPDFVLPLRDIARFLARLAPQPCPAPNS